MSLESIVGFVVTIVLAISAGVYTVYKNLTDRVNKLEKEQHLSVSEEKVRQIIADRIDPLREDVLELRKSIDKLLDHIISLKNK